MEYGLHNDPFIQYIFISSAKAYNLSQVNSLKQCLWEISEQNKSYMTTLVLLTNSDLKNNTDLPNKSKYIFGPDKVWTCLEIRLLLKCI